jgi:hypothetical protein
VTPLKPFRAAHLARRPVAAADCQEEDDRVTSTMNRKSSDGLHGRHAGPIGIMAEGVQIVAVNTFSS